MMLSLLLLAAQATTPAPARAPTRTRAPAAAPATTPAPLSPDEARFNRCIDLATGDPATAEREAGTWRMQGGGFLARQCLGMAYATELRWAAAAAEFEAAANAAEIAKDTRAANYWAQAGNAWLAGGEPARARSALNAALAPATLVGLPRGEAELDRARAAVASGDTASARADIDRALVDAIDDPLAWLLSATLARRMHDLPRAQHDIAETLKRAGDDASAQLEAGNIAALAGDEARAKAAWTRAAQLRPDSDAGRAAMAAIRQFDTPAAAAAPSPAPAH
jgi:Tfp pilus assembly protein PilF